MSKKFNLRSVLFTGLIALSLCSFVFVNSQYNICPMGLGDNAALFKENVKEDIAEKEADFFVIPDVTVLEKGIKLLQRLTHM